MADNNQSDGLEKKDLLALEGISERRLVSAFLEFLRSKSQDSKTTDSARESLEVARQCLMTAFDLSEDRVNLLKPQTSLMEVFMTHPGAIPNNPNQVLVEELRRLPPVSDDSKAKAEDLKNKGNDQMKAGNVDEALKCYTDALELDSTNPIIYCNRAAAYSKKEQHDMAARDCEIALAFDDKYAKAYGRYGLALHGMGLLKEAKEALQKAVDLDNGNPLYKNNLKLVDDAIEAENAQGRNAGASMPGMGEGFPGMGGMGGQNMFEMFNDPGFSNMMSNMLQNPQIMDMARQMSQAFMGQMAGGAGAEAGAGAGTPNNMNIEEMMRRGQEAMGAMGLDPNMIAQQLGNMGRPPAAGSGSSSNASGASGSSDKKKEDKDKDKDQGPPSYFS